MKCPADSQASSSLASVLLRAAGVGEQLDQVAGGGPHAPLVLHRDAQVVKDAAQVGGEPLGIVNGAELDVHPGLADRVGAGAAAPVPWAAPVTSRWTVKSGWTMSLMSACCLFSSIVTESTRYGMSSVTMSMTVPAQVSEASRSGRTLTAGRPCGRCAPSAACRAAVAASRTGPAAIRSSTATSR